MAKRNRLDWPGSAEMLGRMFPHFEADRRLLAQFQMADEQQLARMLGDKAGRPRNGIAAALGVTGMATLLVPEVLRREFDERERARLIAAIEKLDRDP